MVQASHALFQSMEDRDGDTDTDDSWRSFGEVVASVAEKLANQMEAKHANLSPRPTMPLGSVTPDPKAGRHMSGGEERPLRGRAFRRSRARRKRVSA